MSQRSSGGWFSSPPDHAPLYEKIESIGQLTAQFATELTLQDAKIMEKERQIQILQEQLRIRGLYDGY